MSQPEIPDNNLPVFLQEYEVNILNTNKLRPCNDQSCVSAEKGCCPDNVTPVPPSGDCPIGGCATTQFGCCPYSTEAKVDQEGSNCGTIAGSVLYTTVGAIPSNEVGDRVWQLNLSGFLKPGVDTYYIVYDFQKVNYKYKDKITFENVVTGTFNTCGRVLDANRYLTKEFCDKTLTLTIIIDTKKWGFRLKKEVMFSYTINVDDASCPTSSASEGTSLQCKSFGMEITNGKATFADFASSDNTLNFKNPSTGGTVSVELSTNNLTATVVGFEPGKGCSNLAEYYCLTTGDYSNSVTTTSGSSSTGNISLYVIAMGTNEGQDCYTLTIDDSTKEVIFASV